MLISETRIRAAYDATAHNETGISPRTTSLDAHPSSTQSPDLVDAIGYSTSSHASHIITDLGVDQASRGIFADPEVTLPPDIGNETRAMYLEMKALLPVRSIQEELLAIYFQECNWFFGLLEPHCLRKIQKEAEAVEHNVYPSAQQTFKCWRFTALLFQTLAVALQFLPSGTTCIYALGINNRTARDALSESYSNSASQIVSIAGQTSIDVVSVECSLLRAFWLKNAGRGKESWRELGCCVRYTVQTAACSNCPVRLLYIGRRKILSSTWSHQTHAIVKPVETLPPTLPTFGSWSTGDGFGPRYIHGTGMRIRRASSRMSSLTHTHSHLSLSLGRPRAIHPGDCTVGDPTDCDFPSDPTMTEFPIIHDSHRPPSSYTPHWFQHQISKVINQVLSSDELGRRRNQNSEQALQTHLHVLSMLNDLPPAMNSHAPDSSWDATLPALAAKRLHISVTANAFLLALHRRHSRCNPHNRNLAITAALAILQAQHHLCEVLGEVPYKAYMLSYYTIDAGLFLAAVLASHPSSSPQIHMALQQAVARLAWMAGKSPLAASGLAVLRRVYSWTVGVSDEGSQASSLYSSSSSDGVTPTFSTDGMMNGEGNGPRGDDDDALTYSLEGIVGEGEGEPRSNGYDPFMGVTMDDYTLEKFLAQWC